MLSVRSLECESVDFSKMTLFENLEPGQYVVLTVSDTGSGMDEETRAKLFEPFYTTKFAGRGLGLAAVAGIVRGHRGAIRIESEVDRGSTISVLFPAGTQDAMSRTNPSRLDLSVRKENGKVLLVEDENAARELARIVLERAGIEVVEASDGVEAIAIFQAQPDEFNRVLLDLTMPRMDGVETYSRLRKIRADVQVVLCSGYPEQAAMARFADLGLAGFLKKPYEPEQLLDCLECIAEPEDSA
jgi:CheY-like chemotaxis protein